MAKPLPMGRASQARTRRFLTADLQLFIRSYCTTSKRKLQQMFNKYLMLQIGKGRGWFSYFSKIWRNYSTDNFKLQHLFYNFHVLYFVALLLKKAGPLCLQLYSTSNPAKMQHLYLNFLMKFKYLKKIKIHLFYTFGSSGLPPSYFPLYLRPVFV